jgi:hypothetical protein
MSSAFIDLPESTILIGTVTALQGTIPWIVDGSGYTQPVSGTIAATQSGSWTTGRTWTLSSGTDSVNIGNFPATVAVTQSTSPWVIDGTVLASQSGTWNINNISGTVSLPTGAATETTLSAINGKLNSLGQKTMANSVPVVIASNQNSIPISDLSNAGGTQSALTVGTTAVELKVGASPLANRKVATFFNNSNAIIYYGYTSAVTTTTGTPIQKNQLLGWAVGPSTSIYLIAGSAANDGRITESA